MIQKISSRCTVVLVLGLIMVNCGCTKSSYEMQPSAQGANEVWIQNTAFNPSTITVSINTTIKWTNKDGFPHTVTSDSGWFDSGAINSNATFSRQFTSSGTFAYHCSIHPGMLAKVIVH